MGDCRQGEETLDSNGRVLDVNAGTFYTVLDDAEFTENLETHEGLEEKHRNDD